MRNATPGVLALILLAACGCGRRDASELPPVVPAEQLQQTDVLPHPEGPITPGRNYVYCATFQLAWNELSEKIIKEPVKLEGDPAAATILNKASFKQKDLSSDSCLAMAGSVQDGIVGRIRSEMQRRFPSSGFDVPDPASDSMFYIYAYLEKALAFEEKFDRMPQPIEFRTKKENISVQAFGIRDRTYSDHFKKLCSQVTILDYKDHGDFVLRLNTVSKTDELVLAKITPGKTLDETVRAVQARVGQSQIKEWDRGLAISEPFEIPVITVAVQKSYSDLVNKDFRNAGWKGLFIGKADQGIRFRLDESGAQLRSQADLNVKSTYRKEPREFIFDKPFLIYLKERSSQQPYLAIWVETSEVLEPVKQ